ISPGCRARKLAAEGAQKFTSARFGCWRSMSNQSPSVTAMTRLIAILFRRLHFAILGRRQRFSQEGVEQAAAGGGGGGEACLQPVAERHQRIDLGDDAVLFGEGWKGDGYRAELSLRDVHLHHRHARLCRLN